MVDVNVSGIRSERMPPLKQTQFTGDSKEPTQHTQIISLMRWLISKCSKPNAKSKKIVRQFLKKVDVLRGNWHETK